MTSGARPIDADKSAYPLRPRGRTAPDTPTAELERLALQERTHPDASPVTVQALIWLLRASSAAANEIADDLRPLHLSPSAFNVLQALVNTRDQELEPCQLAERLLVSRPSVTGLIDTLEERGLVVRHRHPADRRRVLVALTDDARSLLEGHYPSHYARLHRVFGRLSGDDLATLVSLLRKVRGATPEDLEEPPQDAEPERSRQ